MYILGIDTQYGYQSDIGKNMRFEHKKIHTVT